MNLWIIFFTGLTTGGLSCLAMQGGLLTSVIANQKEQEYDDVMSDKEKRKSAKKKKYVESQKQKNFAFNSFDDLDWMPVGMFLLAKLISYTMVGFLLGLLGSRLALTLNMKLFFQVFTALFMFGTAMNLLDVHPIFRFMAFQPPKFVQKMVKNSSRSKSLFAPAVLGFLTIFIPCGITQAMEILAINSGSPILGALIMFSFVLGTTPLFAFIGIATAKLSEGWHEKFMKVAAVALIFMAVYSINGVLLVLDSAFTIQKITRPVTYFFSDERFTQANSATLVNGVQKIAIGASNSGYTPNRVAVNVGVPVELTVSTNETYSCAAAFVFREFGINTFLGATDSQTFTFTPTKKGRYTYSCSMGMYTGVMEVI